MSSGTTETLVVILNRALTTSEASNFNAVMVIDDGNLSHSSIECSLMNGFVTSGRGLEMETEGTYTVEDDTVTVDLSTRGGAKIQSFSLGRL